MVARRRLGFINMVILSTSMSLVLIALWAQLPHHVTDLPQSNKYVETRNIDLRGTSAVDELQRPVRDRNQHTMGMPLNGTNLHSLQKQDLSITHGLTEHAHLKVDDIQTINVQKAMKLSDVNRLDTNLKETVQQSAELALNIKEQNRVDIQHNIPPPINVQHELANPQVNIQNYNSMLPPGNIQHNGKPAPMNIQNNGLAPQGNIQHNGIPPPANIQNNALLQPVNTQHNGIPPPANIEHLGKPPLVNVQHDGMPAQVNIRQERILLPGNIQLMRMPTLDNVQQALPLQGNIKHNIPPPGNTQQALPGNIQHEIPLPGNKLTQHALPGNVQHNIPSPVNIQHNIPPAGNIQQALPGNTHDIPPAGNIQHEIPPAGNIQHEIPLPGNIDDAALQLWGIQQAPIPVNTDIGLMQPVGDQTRAISQIKTQEALLQLANQQKSLNPLRSAHNDATGLTNEQQIKLTQNKVLVPGMGKEARLPIQPQALSFDTTNSRVNLSPIQPDTMQNGELGIGERFPWIVRKNYLPNFFTKRSVVNGERIPSDSTYSKVNTSVVFVHNQKSGGSTLKMCMESIVDEYHFGKMAVVCDINSGFYYSGIARFAPSELTKFYAGGHTFQMCDFASNPCSYIMVLRDPYERLISSYEYCKARNELHCQLYDANQVSIKEWALFQGSFLFRQLLYNFEFCTSKYDKLVDDLRLLKGLPQTPEEIPCWYRNELILSHFMNRNDKMTVLQYVLNNLEEWFAVVGINDEYDIFLQQLEGAFQLPFARCHGKTVNYHAYVAEGEYEGKPRSSIVTSLKQQLVDDQDVRDILYYDVKIFEKVREITQKQKSASF
ncbi:uncharacterized protein LOC144450762 [Glandiceps talaboti]